MQNLRKEYDFLLKKEYNLKDKNNIKFIGQLIDISEDLEEKMGLQYAIKLCKNFLENLKTGTEEYAFICYFLGNAYSALKKVKKLDNWNGKKEVEKQIKYYKLSLKQCSLSHIMYCQILTNLGNLYDNLGQPIKSIFYRKQALNYNENFVMALGNLAKTLEYYAKLVYDEGHKAILIKKSYELLKKIENINDPYCQKEIKKIFLKEKIEYEKKFNQEILAKDFKTHDYFKIMSKAEKAYRKWCLERELFINPLNDISRESYVATDIMSVPSIIAPINDGPYYHSMFNQIKQEYVSARYLFFEGLTSNKSHFSDKENLIFNTLDYSEYSLNLEKIKIAYRVIYSIFDKISYIINIYFDLKMDYNKVNFRKLWRDRKKEIIDRNNYILVGLYHISHELYNLYEEKDCIDDEYKDLDKIRNFLEHKHIRIKTYDTKSLFNEPSDFAYNISKELFIEKTYKLFSLIREAIIYLSFAINIEEHKKNKEKIFPMIISKIYDKEKI